MKALQYLAALAILAVVAAQTAPAQTDDSLVVEKEELVVLEDGDQMRVVITKDDGNQIVIRKGRGFFKLDSEADGHDRDMGVFHVKPEDWGDFVWMDFDTLSTMDGLEGSLGLRGLFGEHDIKARMRATEATLEVQRLEMKARALSVEARRAEGGERSRLEGELQELLVDIFDRKQKVRQQKIERLRRELDDAESEHDGREDDRGEIIRRRMEELLGRSGFEW